VVDTQQLKILPNTEVASAGLIWLLFVLAFVPDYTRGETLVAGALGIPLVAMGVAANRRVREHRHLSRRSSAQLGFLSLGIGLAMGVAILGALLWFGRIDPEVNQDFIRFAGEPWWKPLGRAFSAAVIEEVVFRYFGMAVLVWIVIWRGVTPKRAYWFSLIATALVFGLVHMSGIPTVAAARVCLNATAGLVVGYVFWRWSLIHAVAIHFFAGLVVQSLGPHLAS